MVAWRLRAGTLQCARQSCAAAVTRVDDAAAQEGEVALAKGLAPFFHATVSIRVGGVCFQFVLSPSSRACRSVRPVVAPVEETRVRRAAAPRMIGVVGGCCGTAGCLFDGCNKPVTLGSVPEAHLARVSMLWFMYAPLQTKRERASSSAQLSEALDAKARRRRCPHPWRKHHRPDQTQHNPSARHRWSLAAALTLPCTVQQQRTKETLVPRKKGKFVPRKT